MAHQHRQADPVVTIEPVSIAGAWRRIVMNVGRFDAWPESLGRRIVDGQRPVTLLTGIELLENDT